tara:strand:- start:6780 stop:7217 length:438 start_codon:yes stop_codon:yes gene_type:complete
MPELNKTYKYRNLTGDTAINITSDITYFKEVEYLCFCNTHATDSCSLDMYTQFTGIIRDNYLANVNDYTAAVNSIETYYHIKNVVIPAGVTLKLSSADFIYDSSGLVHVQLAAAGSTVDLIVKGVLSNMFNNEQEFSEPGINSNY